MQLMQSSQTLHLRRARLSRSLHYQLCHNISRIRQRHFHNMSPCSPRRLMLSILLNWPYTIAASSDVSNSVMGRVSVAWHDTFALFRGAWNRKPSLSTHRTIHSPIQSATMTSHSHTAKRPSIVSLQKTSSSAAALSEMDLPLISVTRGDVMI